MSTEFNQHAEERLRAVVAEIAFKMHAAEESLTQAQFIEAVVQAVKCGDFTRYTFGSENKQAVVYLPFARVQQLEARVRELETQIRNMYEAKEAERGEIE